MIVLVSGSTRTVSRLASAWPDHLGHLLTPNNRNSVGSILKTGLPWAVDNGAFKGFDAERFECLLAKVANKPRLCWIACPDVVADARATLDRFHQWAEIVGAAGPVAFVGQDGQEDLPVPWEWFDCLFIGGSTEWKLSEAAGDLMREAKMRGKWVHVGRVNSLRRLRTMFDAGADSVDGSSLSMFGDKYIHKFCAWVRRLEKQPTMY